MGVHEAKDLEVQVCGHLPYLLGLKGKEVLVSVTID